MWMLLALLSVSFLQTFAPPAHAGALPDQSFSLGKGGPDDPDDITGHKTKVQPFDPAMEITVSTVPQRNAGISQRSALAQAPVSVWLKVIRDMLSAYLQLR